MQPDHNFGLPIEQRVQGSPLGSQGSRRWFLRLGGAWTAILAACRSKTGGPPSEPRALGATVSPYGGRSRFEKVTRYFNQNTKVPLEEASSRTPLHDTYGIITPSSLHFERHHAGVPEIDPAAHTLTIHGLVDRPLVFTVDELKRFPSISRIHFLECSGNSGSEWRGAGEPDVQRAHGLTSCSEWTGVSLALLLKECGIQSASTWILAEGADPCRLAAASRSKRPWTMRSSPTRRTASRFVPSRVIRCDCSSRDGKATPTSSGCVDSKRSISRR
jgi:sulfane dehydrogenase subunit SoxC